MLDMRLDKPDDNAPIQEKFPWKCLLTFSSNNVVGSTLHISLSELSQFGNLYSRMLFMYQNTVVSPVFPSITFLFLV